MSPSENSFAWYFQKLKPCGIKHFSKQRKTSSISFEEDFSSVTHERVQKLPVAYSSRSDMLKVLSSKNP